MGRISISVNDRRFDINCDDGQEDHVRRMAGRVNDRIRELVGKVGQVGETRLLLLTALLLEDELAEVREMLGSGQRIADASTLGASRDESRHGTEPSQVEQDLDALVQRIEAVAQRLKAP